MQTRRRPPAHDSAELIVIYQCLCDETRLRILNLLAATDHLCVCHLQRLLDKTQVQISKHLAYLKTKGLVDSTRRANWMLYRLPNKRSPELSANLRCLQDCVQTHSVFKRDIKRLRALQPSLNWLSCSAKAKGRK
ncbi:MAG: metalloregulator ArsR/SmtB family transcription factor [Chthoniobacteraceae bacterium]|jgi:ArsR family transcriptional regulator